MFEKIFKKQEKVQENVQEKVQKQQKLNDEDCELTDEELDRITGGGAPVRFWRVPKPEI